MIDRITNGRPTRHKSRRAERLRYCDPRFYTALDDAGRAGAEAGAQCRKGIIAVVGALLELGAAAVEAALELKRFRIAVLLEDK